MNKQLLAAGAAFCVLGTPLPALAVVSLGSVATPYTQSFDSLAGTAWANDSTLDGWSLFNSTGAAISSIVIGNGAANTGGFYSYGATASTDRALGGLGSGGTYFGSPASNTPAGYIVLAVRNDTGSTLSSVDIRFDGEQWRNGGNTSAQPMVLDLGQGTSYATAQWVSSGISWSSPVTGSTAAAVDGNAAGRVAGVGAVVATSWAPGDTLWLRWTELNDVGNDHGLAIDNLSLAVTAVPEPGAAALLLAGLGLAGMVGLRARRRH